MGYTPGEVYYPLQLKELDMVCGKVVALGEVFLLVNIYAPNNPKSKIKVWSELSLLYWNYASLSTLMLGDFNCVRNKEDREKSFNNFVTDFSLQELDSEHEKFAWFGLAGKKSRLDRLFENHG